MNFEHDIENCLSVLHAGGLILYPTDTVWGIGCDATQADAVEKIYQLKKRPDSKSMIVLVADEKDILQYVAAPDLQIFDYLHNVHKPTTVVYEGIIGVAENLIGADGTLAIRICQDAFCRNLIKRFRKPIVSTSANISGQPTPPFFNKIREEIKKGVDYVVQYRQSDTTPTVPSSVIKWVNGEVLVLRP